MPGGWLQFQSLHDAIYTSGVWAEALSNFSYCLMVRTINTHFAAADFSKNRTVLNLHIMDDFVFFVRAAMVDCLRNFGRNIDNQTAAEGDIENLMSAANRQQWLALAKDFIDQHQFEKIALRRRGTDGFFQFRRQLFRVNFRCDVIATSQDQTVASTDRFRRELPIRQTRQHPGHTAR